MCQQRRSCLEAADTLGLNAGCFQHLTTLETRTRAAADLIRREVITLLDAHTHIHTHMLHLEQVNKEMLHPGRLGPLSVKNSSGKL